MDTTQQVILESIENSASSISGHSFWMWLSIVELVIIIALIYALKAKSSKAMAKKKFREESLSEDLDLGNVINSSFHATPLYDELKKVCHPDRFLNESDREKANEIFQLVNQHRRDFNRLTSLKEQASRELGIKFKTK